MSQKSKTKQLADIILSMTYTEIMSLANTLEGMQSSAKDDGFEWDSTQADGQYGIAAMLTSWAEGCDE